MNLQDSKDRENLVRRLQSQLTAKVKTEQSALYLRIAGLVNSLETDGQGSVRNTVANLNVQNKVVTQFNQFQTAQRGGLLKWVVRAVLKLLGVNRSFFSSDLRADNVHKQAVKRFLLRLGVSNGKIVTGSWLDSLGAATSVKVNVMRRMAGAILGGASLKDFSKNLANDFIGKLGLLERHWNTHASTLMISVDRETQLFYADRLNLNYALYSGTIKNNTRPFCKHRAGRIYTRAEVNGWNNQQWAGKIEEADVKSVAGGYKCRHSFNWITETTAKAIAEQRGIEINTYA